MQLQWENNLSLEPKCVVDLTLFEVLIIEELVWFEVYFNQKYLNEHFIFVNHKKV